MLPRLAWAGAIAPKWVQPASIRGSAPPSTFAHRLRGLLVVREPALQFAGRQR